MYTCEQALVWICAVVNQKGGVEKTAVTLGLASALRQRGRKVLVVDMDPQANAIAGLGVTGEPETLTIGDALAAPAPGIAADVITATGWGEAIASIPADAAGTPTRVLGLPRLPYGRRAGPTQWPGRVAGRNLTPRPLTPISASISGTGRTPRAQRSGAGSVGRPRR